MRKSQFLSVYLFLLLMISVNIAQDFEQEQRRFPRVRASFTEKESKVKALFDTAHLSFPPTKIYIRIYKFEQKLELWATETSQDTFKLVARYNFCSSSGHLGPKRQQGDFQIPEGFYHIDRFNPTSNFYLSLGINYPNASDKILGNKESLGGDIFIHGDCVTIGCVPITDDKIKELYIIAVKSKANGQKKIPVHIFPFDFTHLKTKDFIHRNEFYKKQQAFWEDLEKGHAFFEQTHKLPKIRVDISGHYTFSK